ncbi:MAG: zinc ABC transporter substrate-binding protein [Verrucomicrobiales bacterium]|nr:zinc ABC transporter substrate-binding protein [Verrucomicrobiales bacterium]
MPQRNILLTLVLFVPFLMVGCKEELVDEPGKKPVVYVPVPPYKEIASRLAGDSFEVRSLVSESDDPHDFSPTPKQVSQLSQASILFTGEMPFEKNLVEKIVSGNSKVKVFSLTKNVTLLEGSCDHPSHTNNDVYVYVKGQDDKAEHDHDHAKHDHDHAEHDHDHAEHDHDHAEHDHDHAEHDHDHAEHDHDHAEHDHDHAEHDHDHAEHDHHHHDHELDPHVWLSPRILKAQATTIAGILKNAAPDAGAQIDENLKTVHADLDRLDTQLAEKLAFMKGKKFYVYHGAFAYFAEAYGLKQEAIELSGRRPEPKRLAALVEQAKNEGVKLIFVQPQFDQSSAKSLADSIGGKVLMLDPLDQNIFTNLQHIADSIGQSAVTD